MLIKKIEIKSSFHLNYYLIYMNNTTIFLSTFCLEKNHALRYCLDEKAKEKLNA